MKATKDKQKEVTAATFKRLAKALRVRARNHRRTGKAFSKNNSPVLAEWENVRADLYTGFASDLDHEAAKLRGMR